MHIASTALVAFFLASEFVSAHSVASRDPSVVIETVYVSAPESEAPPPAPLPHKSHYHKSHHKSHQKFHHKLAHKHKEHHDATPAPAAGGLPSLADSIPANVPAPRPAAQPSPPSPQPAPSPTKSQPPVPAPAPEPASTPPATPPSSTSTSPHPQFQHAGWPSYMDSVNYYRDQLGLSQLEWSPKLDAGAQRVCHTCNGQQVHNDGHDGWRGQVLCPADQNDFDNVFLYGWLCERPKVGALAGLCPSGIHLFDHSNGETGHFDIVANPQFKQIGCAWYKGIWCCDLC